MSKQEEAASLSAEMDMRNNYYEDKIDMLNRIAEEKDKHIEELEKKVADLTARNSHLEKVQETYWR